MNVLYNLVKKSSQYSGYFVLIAFSTALITKFISYFFVEYQHSLKQRAEDIFVWVVGFFLVTIIFDLWHRYIYDNIRDYYESMSDAENDIIKEISNASKKNVEVTKIRIIGCRYTHINKIINKFVNKYKDRIVDFGKLEFEIYYIDKEYLKKNIAES